MDSFKKIDPAIVLSLEAELMMETICVYKDKEKVYAKASSPVLKALVEQAMIENVESSNRSYEITVDPKRLRALAIGNSRPQDHSEKEIAGYTKALELITRNYHRLVFSPSMIQDLHRLIRADADDAGQWKTENNSITKKYSNGKEEIFFVPLEADKVPAAMENLCASYRGNLSKSNPQSLLGIACLILDFSAIHPFRDGNGRLSRLLMILALYQHGYGVCRYISVERIVEQSKAAYYAALNKSSQGWHQSTHDLMPWFHYFLKMMMTAYKEFDQKAGVFHQPKPSMLKKIDAAISKVLVNAWSISNRIRELFKHH